MPRPEDYETVYENGKKFKELPIVFLNADKNNTKLGMTGEVGKMGHHTSVWYKAP